MRYFLSMLAAGLFAAGTLSPAADAAPIADQTAVMHSAIDLTGIEKTQYVWGGRNYCWYDNGWRGPGWYWCGYAWRSGLGWGGGFGWRGWSWHSGRYWSRSGHWRGGGHHGGWHGGGGHRRRWTSRWWSSRRRTSWWRTSRRRSSWGRSSRWRSSGWRTSRRWWSPGRWRTSRRRASLIANVVLNQREFRRFDLMPAGILPAFLFADVIPPIASSTAAPKIRRPTSHQRY